MADSACLMQQIFSHPSDSHHEPKEGDPIHALGESISFGRFMSESLSWERWSSFNRNRYLEEAEKYSRPGSVVQKKAYFEAHYKRIAQQKAAALLEQANAAANEVPDPEIDGVYSDGVRDSELDESNRHVVVDEQEDVKEFSAEVGSSIGANDYNSSCKNDSFETAKVEEADLAIEEQLLVENSTLITSPNQHRDVERQSNVENGSLETIKVEETDLVIEEQMLVENSTQIKSPNQHRYVENQSNIIEVEICATKQIKEAPLKESLAANQDSLALTAKVKPVSSLYKTPVFSIASKTVSPPARPRTPVYPRRENNATPNSKKPSREAVDKKRSTPKSLRMSINYAPPCRASEINKMSSPILHKHGDSRVGSSSNQTSKNCSTPLRTPSRVSTSVNAIPKPPPLTPQSGSTRPKTPLGNRARASRNLDVKCQSLCIERPNSSSASRNKACSLVVSSSFSFRSDERAAKRKEYFQKLEEKFNAKEAQKMQLQIKSKEKEKTELRKLRQSLSFKAKPMPDFYRETGSPNSQIKKIPLTKPQSPKLGRKPSPGPIGNTSSLPPRRPSLKSDDSKHATGESIQTPTSSVASQPKKKAHENAYPNIQS